MEKLRNLGDPDTDSSLETNHSDADVCPRLRLSFNDSTDECQVPEKRSSKYFEDRIRNNNKKADDLSNEENLDISDLGETLERRIQRKMFNVNDRPQNINQKTKSTNSNNKTVENNATPLKDLSKNKNEKIKQTGIDFSAKHVQSKTTGKKTDEQNSRCSRSSSFSSDEEWERELSKIVYKKPKTGSYSFLASLSCE